MGTAIATRAISANHFNEVTMLLLLQNFYKTSTKRREKAVTIR
jgi:hypothetical protein